MVEYLAGVLAIAAFFLSLVAGVIAISMFRVAHSHARLRPWKYLLIVLFLFMIQEVLGVLKFFKLFETPYLTHIIPTAMLLILIYAISIEILIARTE
jgi:hypothetical protein